MNLDWRDRERSRVLGSRPSGIGDWRHIEDEQLAFQPRTFTTERPNVCTAGLSDRDGQQDAPASRMNAWPCVAAEDLSVACLGRADADPNTDGVSSDCGAS